MRLYKVVAIILKQIPYQNEDIALFSVFSDTLGKVTINIKKTDKLLSKTRLLEALSLCELTLFKNSKDQYRVNEINLIATYHPKDFKDLKGLNLIFEISEFVRKKVEDDSPDSNIFNLLNETMQILKSSQKEYIVEAFYIKFLRLLGSFPNITNCRICKNKCDSSTSKIALNEMYLVCENCDFSEPTEFNHISLQTLKFIKYCIESKMEDINKVLVPSTVLAELKELNSHLKTHL